MRLTALLALVAFDALQLVAPRVALGDEAVIEDFESAPENRWRFVADTVMGGVSTGDVDFVSRDGDSFARMTGRVSTENNGGFIQFRTKLPDAAPEGTTGVRLWVRGNGERYFVHLRTGGTILPWQYYQAGFETGPDWTEIRLPLAAFAPSGWILADTPAADSLTSVGIVAFGRDHEAEIEVREVGFY